jgi:branched-chain amino acid transport system substrate-binding protein
VESSRRITLQSQGSMPGQPAKRTVSLVIAIILLIVGAGVGGAVGYLGARFSSPSSGLCTSGSTITIGALLDLTKDLSDQGVRAKYSTAMAIDDVNAMLTAASCNLKFAITVDDYQLDNSIAQNDLTAFAASGVQVVVGPLNSGTAQYLLSYANSHKIVMISPSSTSPALAISDDYLFRTVPNDAAQGLADARIMYGQGVRSVVIINRHDTYGDGLANATRDRFTTLGGHVQDIIAYDTATQDFTAQLTTLNSDYQAANATYPNQVAIFAVSFQEFGSMIIQANNQHPKLLSGQQPWYGTDGEADNTVLATNSTVGPLVAKVKMVSTLFSPTNNTRSFDFYTKYASAHPGYTCDSYCLGAYDDVWLAALSTLQAGAYDGAKIHAIFPTVAAGYYGVTGWTGLQSSGDRIPTSYQIWEVTNPSSPKWNLAGEWDYSSDTVAWNAGFP